MVAPPLEWVWHAADLLWSTIRIMDGSRLMYNIGLIYDIRLMYNIGLIYDNRLI